MRGRVIVLLNLAEDMLRPITHTRGNYDGRTKAVAKRKNKQLTELAKQAIEDLDWLLQCQKEIPYDLECGELMSMEEVKEQAELVQSYMNKMLFLLNH